MQLADLFYKIAHRGDSGQPRLHDTTIGYGLAAALLAELIASSHITTDGTTLMVLSRRPPDNLLAHQTLDLLLTEPQQHPLKDWLRYLSRTATTDVAQRLVRTGEVEKTSHRKLMRTKTVYLPVSVTDFDGPYAVLRMSLLHQRIATWDYGWCAGFAKATGLHQFLLEDSSPASAEYLDWTIAQLPAPGKNLINVTATAIGEAVLAHR